MQNILIDFFPPLSFYCPLGRVTDAELISAPPYVNQGVESAVFPCVTQHKFQMSLLFFMSSFSLVP